MKSKLLYLHFALLVVVLVNFGSKVGLNFALQHTIAFTIKTLWYGSGLVLFFFYLKPIKIWLAYFAMYWLQPFLSVFLGGFDSLIRNDFSIEPTTIATFNTYQLSKKIMGMGDECCQYEVTKIYFYILESKLTEFYTSTEIIRFSVDETQKKVYFNDKHIKLP